MALVANVKACLEGRAPGGGKRKICIVQFVFDAAYPAKGYALAASTLGLTTIEAILFGGISITDTADSVCVPAWDAAAGKIMIGEAGADGAALDDATNTSLTTGSNVYAIVIGF